VNLKKILAPYRNKEIITFWTVHPYLFWQLLQKQGEIKADGRRSWILKNDPSARRAYQWMNEQMKIKIPSYRAGYPLWAYFFKPDLRQRAYEPTGTHAVRIEFRIPAEKVILSDYESWHAPLNNWYLWLTGKEYKWWEKRETELTQLKLFHRLQKEKEQSWSRIFDLETVGKAKSWGPIDIIQATFEKLTLDQVVKVDEFIAR